MLPQKILKIFIVDDDPFCRQLYSQCLKSLGYMDILPIESGQECLDQLFLKPDIIFLDYYMAGLNGLETLKNIKSITQDIHVVLCSSQEDMQVAINSLKYGALDYIIKGSDERGRIKAIMEQLPRLTSMLKRQKRKRTSLLGIFS